MTQQRPRRPLTLPVLLALSLGVGACARYPSTTVGNTPSLLTVSIPVVGSINPNYYYFVALQAPNPGAQTPPATNVPSADPTLGPFAVVRAIPGQSTWGNGWGAGRITDYVVFNGNQASQYSVNCADVSCSAVLQPNPGVYVGPPFEAQVTGPNNNVLQISVDLSTLGLNGSKSNPTHSLPPAVVVNVITTDHITTNPNDPPKPIDSIDGSLPLLILNHSSSAGITPPNPVQFPSSSVVTNDLQLDQSQQIQLDWRLSQ